MEVEIDDIPEAGTTIQMKCAVINCCGEAIR